MRASLSRSRQVSAKIVPFVFDKIGAFMWRPESSGTSLISSRRWRSSGERFQGLVAAGAAAIFGLKARPVSFRFGSRLASKLIGVPYQGSGPMRTQPSASASARSGEVAASLLRKLGAHHSSWSPPDGIFSEALFAGPEEFGHRRR